MEARVGHTRLYDMANLTPAQIRQAVDDKLAAAWTQLQNRQTAYLGARGRYFQGIKTHVVTPADGDETAPDLTGRPTDQAETWTGAGFNLPATLPMALQIDTYDGPQGKGYVGILWVQIGGQLWRRSAQVGPETWRARAWEQVT